MFGKDVTKRNTSLYTLKRVVLFLMDLFLLFVMQVSKSDTLNDYASDTHRDRHAQFLLQAFLSFHVSNSDIQLLVISGQVYGL